MMSTLGQAAPVTPEDKVFVLLALVTDPEAAKARLVELQAEAKAVNATLEEAKAAQEDAAAKLVEAEAVLTHGDEVARANDAVVQKNGERAAELKAAQDELSAEKNMLEVRLLALQAVDKALADKAVALDERQAKIEADEKLTAEKLAEAEVLRATLQKKIDLLRA